MSDYEPTTGIGGDSGLYRKLKSWLFPSAVFVLWAIVAALGAGVWQDVNDHSRRLSTLEAQRQSDHDLITNLKDAIKDIQSDIKELLREVRK